MKFMRELARWSRFKQRSGALMRIARALRVFVPMLRDVTAGRYRPVPWTACGWMAAALAYLIMPFDIIPDFLMLIGVVDDVFIVGWLLTRVDDSLAPYRRWKGIDPPDTAP
ncbi:YkvA family protein [Chromohalobacter sp. HP20-39]|uniref:YkvA family protein n=1 Tax=Chromohalobacter sp. HP20-39 TaxID=3079306 RepID=UPI00294B0E4C|nr:YkvA family protein [Chromohalobacter sp. HP20-39]MDV6317461.1 YkvA family protein [Chromohalobacter sp. HP20-39]